MVLVMELDTFLNVHEGPHAISKRNKIVFHEGMVVSNEPGYYEKNKFGIRIENLIYVKSKNQNMNFENLTMAPIDKDLIIKENLNKNEKKNGLIIIIKLFLKI